MTDKPVALTSKEVTYWSPRGLANGFVGVAQVSREGEPLKPWEWNQSIQAIYVRVQDYELLATAEVGQGAGATTVATEPVCRPDSLPSQEQVYRDALERIANHPDHPHGSYIHEAVYIARAALAASVLEYPTDTSSNDSTITSVSDAARISGETKSCASCGDLLSVIRQLAIQIEPEYPSTANALHIKYGQLSEKVPNYSPFEIGSHVRFIDPASDHVEWIVYRLHDGWVHMYATDDRTYTHWTDPKELRIVKT